MIEDKDFTLVSIPFLGFFLFQQKRKYVSKLSLKDVSIPFLGFFLFQRSWWTCISGYSNRFQSHFWDSFYFNIRVNWESKWSTMLFQSHFWDSFYFNETANLSIII